MTEPVQIRRGTPYTPGEPYEFLMYNYFGTRAVLHYRCFRGGCKGTPIYVDDRNTHNDYHNEAGH